MRNILGLEIIPKNFFFLFFLILSRGLLGRVRTLFLWLVGLLRFYLNRLGLFWLNGFINLSFFFISLMDILVKGISIFFNGELFIIVHWNFNRFFANKLLFRIMKISYIWMGQGLIDSHSMFWVEDQKSLLLIILYYFFKRSIHSSEAEPNN